VILTVVNLDPFHTQAGWVEVRSDQLALDPHEPFQVHDLLGDARFQWNPGWNYVSLDPGVLPAHIFRFGRPPAAE
jgi:starch synthase (maltosyl-transferring)